MGQPDRYRGAGAVQARVVSGGGRGGGDGRELEAGGSSLRVGRAASVNASGGMRGGREVVRSRIFAKQSQLVGQALQVNELEWVGRGWRRVSRSHRSLTVAALKRAAREQRNRSLTVAALKHAAPKRAAGKRAAGEGLGGGMARGGRCRGRGFRGSGAGGRRGRGGRAAGVRARGGRGSRCDPSGRGGGRRVRGRGSRLDVLAEGVAEGPLLAVVEVFGDERAGVDEVELEGLGFGELDAAELPDGEDDAGGEFELDGAGRGRGGRGSRHGGLRIRRRIRSL